MSTIKLRNRIPINYCESEDASFEECRRKRLRKRIPVSYYEPEEPPFDEYVYCEKCADDVYEYCSIHGPLLVIPDDQVPLAPGLPTCVPRAALTIPRTFLHLAPSIIPGAGIGVFSSLTLPAGVRFGPFRGVRTRQAGSMYCWQLYNGNRKPSHVVDAGDADASNWMRYVNCARHWREQNLLAFQYQGQMYYRTVKIIPRYTELMVFYGSEFAMSLDIDLRRYNGDEYYQRIIDQSSEKQNQKCLIDDSVWNNGTQPSSNTGAVNFLCSYKDVEDSSSSYEIPVENFIFIDEYEHPVDQQFNVQSVQPTEHSSVQPPEHSSVQATKHSSVQSTVTSNGLIYKRSIGQSTQQPIVLLTTLFYLPVEQNCRNTDQSTKYSVEQINKSQNDSHNLKIATCQVCFKTYSSKHQLKIHLLRIHKKMILCKKNHKYYICDVCSYPCENQFYFDRHKLTHKKYTNVCNECCNVCGFKTNSEVSFRLHLRKHLPENTYKCDHCSYCTPKRSSITRHMKIHFKQH